MPRQALHTDDIKIEQKSDISDDPSKYTGDIVKAEKIDRAMADELAFNEEPMTIRLEPSSEQNAATSYPVWVNGKGCEVLMNGRWLEMTYIPVGIVVTTKRKYVEGLIRSKIDTLHTTKTDVEDVRVDSESNVIRRFTRAVHSLSIIEDRNPAGIAWLSEIRRRNF